MSSGLMQWVLFKLIGESVSSHPSIMIIVAIDIRYSVDLS